MAAMRARERERYARRRDALLAARRQRYAEDDGFRAGCIERAKAYRRRRMAAEAAAAPAPEEPLAPPAQN